MNQPPHGRPSRVYHATLCLHVSAATIPIPLAFPRRTYENTSLLLPPALRFSLRDFALHSFLCSLVFAILRTPFSLPWSACGTTPRNLVSFFAFSPFLDPCHFSETFWPLTLSFTAGIADSSFVLSAGVTLIAWLSLLPTPQYINVNPSRNEFMTHSCIPFFPSRLHYQCYLFSCNIPPFPQNGVKRFSSYSSLFSFSSPPSDPDLFSKQPSPCVFLRVHPGFMVRTKFSY